MMRSLYSGVSGLKNHQTRMDVVGNNISNVNTTGFKSGRVTFSDTLSQTLSGASRADAENALGGTNPKQIGLGSAVSSIDTLFTDGSVQSTGNNTDLCLSGNGLFVVKSGGVNYYTRNGAFKFDEQGNYVNSDGIPVMGWMADDAGKLNTSADIGGIKIPAGKPMAAKSTTKFTYANNLDSTAAIGDAVNTSATVYDSQGGAHTIPIIITKDSANTWKLSLPTATPYVINEASGNVNVTFASNTDLKFTTSGKYDSGSAKLHFTYNDGGTPAKQTAADQDVDIDLKTLTQFSGSSTAYASNDGNAAGTLKSVSIDSSGVITGTYTNGVNKAEAQVAVAQFNNAAGLTKEGNSLYSKSNNSGEPNIKGAKDLGTTITPSALEMSNVDLASELTDMIVTQRGYQSNSKIITVSDELLETLIGMKR